MKIAVFGSTGNIGKLLVEQALSEGYGVVAYARNPSKLKIMHDRLTIVQGELSDEMEIEQAVNDVDVVISAMGPTCNTKGNPITQGYETHHRGDEEAWRAPTDRPLKRDGPER